MQGRLLYFSTNDTNDEPTITASANLETTLAVAASLMPKPTPIGKLMNWRILRNNKNKAKMLANVGALANEISKAIKE
jgi:hypothetical protein